MKQPAKNRFSAKKAARFGLLVALALIFSYAESQIPPFFAVPGMKIGLTNVVVLTALYKMGSGPAMGVNLLRIFLVGLLFGNPFSVVYSLSGGMLSTVVMILLRKSGRFRLITVSVAGGVFHNVGQIAAAAVIMQTAQLGWYMVVLWFTGMLTGALIGVLGYEMVRRLPDALFE